MPTNDSLVLALVGLVGIDSWLGGGVNISNASPKCLQLERVISGSCRYPSGYHSSDPTTGQTIVLGPPSILAYLNDLPFIPCHGSN